MSLAEDYASITHDSLAEDYASITHDSHVSLFQACFAYDNEHGGVPSLQLPGTTSLEGFCHKGHSRVTLEDSGFLESLVDYQACHLPTPSDPCNSSSGSYCSFGNMCSRPEDSQSILHHKASSDCLSSDPLMLSFEQEHSNSQLRYSRGNSSTVWDITLANNRQLHHPSRKNSTDPLLLQEVNCFETANCHGGAVSILNESRREEELGWLYSKETPGDGLQEKRGPGSHKRSCMVDVPGSKRHCDGAHGNSKTKSVTSKDSQSMAAKNRRERISERLKILQDLVPNGNKLDLVTMLEKAISYVKFLQLQVKVLTTDEFWPTHDRKVPDAAQMKDAIDVILSSHKDRTSIPK